MKKQTKKLFATAFAIWSCFIGPIIAGTVTDIRNDDALTPSAGMVIDSLMTQEPPGTLDPPPGELWLSSYYGGSFHGRYTASGEIYNKYALTCAHKTLPFNTRLKITNPNNGKSIVVRVNDRGPFFRNRKLDLSYGAAKEIDMLAAGVLKLRVEILPNERITQTDSETIASSRG